MEIRAVSLAASHLFSPSPLSPSNSPQTLAFASAKPYHFPTTQSAIPLPVELGPIRRPRARSCSRPHGLSGARMSAVKVEPSLTVKNKAAEISYALKGTSIFLVGMNCNIKTNLGKLLADALRYYYFDSDSLVEQAVGGTAESFRGSDEKGFRDSETEVLKQLSSMGRLVVSAGDGAVQSSSNLAYLRYGISVWIDVPIDLLADEILKTEVPSSAAWATPDSEGFSKVLQELAKRYNEMKGGYGTADATVSLQKVASQLGYEDMDSVTPEDMAMEALKEIERLTRVKKMMEAAARPF